MEKCDSKDMVSRRTNKQETNALSFNMLETGLAMLLWFAN